MNQAKVDPSQYEISLLSCAGAENYGQEEKIAFNRTYGKSGASAIFLALLSALHQKPIAWCFNFNQKLQKRQS